MSSSLSVVRQPLVDIVIERLRHLIAGKTWPVGMKIPNEAELSNLFDVGRNTIREAIRVLSHSGMLEVRQGDGTYVRSEVDPSEIMRCVSMSGLKDHLELQYILEAEAAVMAATRRREDDLVKISDALKNRAQYSNNGSPEDFIDKDNWFHMSIIEATHNDAMIALYKYFSLSIKHNHQHLMSVRNLPEPDQHAHQKLYEAIAAGDPVQARETVRQMLEPMIELLKKL
ncbi:TPA: FadR/GntR family transcriptional regulator [Klebsiella pneumoniae]